MKLQILICTIDEGIVNIPHQLCEPRPDVGYLVSWQQTEGFSPPHLPQAIVSRPDVTVVTLAGKGLSANRNNALRHARPDCLLLIADDDSCYTHQYFDTIIKAFDRHPKAQILTFQAIDEDSRPMRNYSPTSFEYKERPRFTTFSSWEIAMRNSPVLPHFDERFGLGSAYLACGEEEVFLHQASLAGIKITYIPEVIVRTRRFTTGQRFATDVRVRRSKGAVLCLIHGPFSAWLRCVKAAALYSRLRPRLFLSTLSDLVSGIRYIRQSQG